MLYEGIPVNITLLFSIERYADIAKAYIRAFEYLDAEGLPMNQTVSVASFFLSRIDNTIEEDLEEACQILSNYQIDRFGLLTEDENENLGEFTLFDREIFHELRPLIHHRVSNGFVGQTATKIFNGFEIIFLHESA